MSRFFRIGLIMLLLIGNAGNLFAGVEPYKNFIKGQLHVGDSLVVKDEKFKNPQFNWANITNISVHNRIELRIFQEQPITQNFDCEIQLRVEYYSSPEQVMPTQIQQVKLNVAYRTGEAVAHQLIDHYSFMNGYLVKIFITQISSPQHGQTPPPILELTNSILIDRQYKFNAGTPVTLNGTTEGEQTSPPRGFFGRLLNPQSQTQNNGHQLKLEWEAMMGAEEYDIEWTPVDKPGDFAAIADAMKNNSALESQVESIFKNNATRITTEEQSYVISLLYNAAYIIVRMRQVSYDSISGLREEGPWYYKKSDETYAIWEPTWHEQNLNWQYSASFAEQGKKKEVVSYFDGTFRNRQTATLNNNDHVAVVQENVYDEFGRPFLSILPAPHLDENVSEQYLKYFPNFNRSSVTPKNNFSFRDINFAICGLSPINFLSNESGASKYYSNQNTFPNTSYVPDAENYPFSLTEYTADGTGRIKVQGGVGKNFQPGLANGHTTKYYYGKPDQWELDRIFGNDVGYAEHYLKQTIVDPNGQASVSYTNASGKTIATALVGGKPDNQTALPSFGNATEFTSTLLKPEQFSYDAATLKFTASATYLATALGNINLRYQVNKLIDLYQSGPIHPCSNCFYILKVKVVDDCNVVYKEAQIPIGSLMANCEETGLHTEEINFQATRLGEYYVSFEMAIPTTTVDSYTDKYIEQAISQNALTKESQFIKNYIDRLDFKTIFADCRTAVRQLGSRNDFTNMVKNSLIQMGLESDYTMGTVFHNYVDTKYTELYAHVIALEENCITSPCQAVKTELLIDVSPYGQYALFNAQGDPLEISINVLYNYFRAVFPESSDPLILKTQLVTREDNSVISVYSHDFNLKDLVKYWKPEWAELFLDKHPEYCKLQACEANSAYLTWDEKLTDIYSKSSDISRISPGLAYSVSNVNWLIDVDPFFSGVGASYKTAMEQDLATYSETIVKTTNSNKNLGQYILYSLYCAQDAEAPGLTDVQLQAIWNSCSPNQVCRVEDREWAMYKQIYLELKQKYYGIREMGICANASALACLPTRSYEFGSPGNPALRDIGLEISSVSNGYQVVTVKSLNGAVSGDRIIWFDPNPLASYKSLRNYVLITNGTNNATYYLPEGIPLSALKVTKIQQGPFEYARMYFDDYFRLITEEYYEGDEGYRYAKFGLREGMFPPNNAFDQYQTLSSQVVIRQGAGVYGGQNVNFNAANQYIDDFYIEYYYTLASGIVEGYVDYPIFPLNSGCPPEMANKTVRFPSSGMDPNAGGPTDANSKLSSDEQLNGLIKSTCEVNVDNWITALDSETSPLTTLQKTNLRLRLLAICMSGGSMEYPGGKSSLPSGQTTIYGDNNFGQVLKSIVNASFTMRSNPWILETPAPHGVKLQVNEKYISNSSLAISNKIAGLRPNGYSNAQFYNHLVSTYGAAMTMSLSDFEILLAANATCRYLLASDVKLPFILDPESGGCIDRSQFNNAMFALNAEISGGLDATTDRTKYANIVANYMNQTFGFALSFDQYEQFSSDQTKLTLCNEAPFTAIEPDPYASIKALLAIAVTNGKSEYESYIKKEKNLFRLSYISTCTAARPNVQVVSSAQIYHYTLYYYDQAGNLVRTVPPEGVKVLSGDEIQQVNDFRKGAVVPCLDGPQEASIKDDALRALANVLGRNGDAAVEQWLYKASGGRQFMATTTDLDFIFNTCISGNYLNIDIYKTSASGNSMSLTKSNHITVNIGGVLPLQPWTHVVVQRNNLLAGALDVYINGSKFNAVTDVPAPGCGWQLGGDPFVRPENVSDIKYLRVYTRLMLPTEILANANSSCRTVANNTAMQWFRFNAVPEDTQPAPFFPDHVLPTSYVYNSMNQVTKQQTPDAGQSRFGYDNLGRLVYSQNAKQASNQQVSYTLYDNLSRIKEVGQINGVMYAEEFYFGDAYLLNYETALEISESTAREQITSTYYDTAIDGFNLFTPFLQENLRKRVSASTYRDTYNGAVKQSSYYTYDLNGNVKTLGNYIDGLGHKRLDYDYDLISGKVNFLAYQHGSPDAFYYKYNYDPENRLTEAWSGTQGIFKSYGGSYLLNGKLDAKYYYYLHGPLRRVELGDESNLVQGTDYAYTLQGWLKGVNGTSLNDPNKDMGNDGATIGRDVLAYSLGYYHDDYLPIGANANAFGHHFQQTGIPAVGGSGMGLYNGNISHSTYAIGDAIGGINGGATVGYTYGYDQLNRLKVMRQHTLSGLGNWSFSENANFREEFDYDGNGNIVSLKRRNESGVLMDNLTYGYNRNPITNRLSDNRLGQVGNTAAITGSVKGTNYGYDLIGNLTSDTEEHISGIDWTVYGKIRQITKNNSTPNISYNYDASGNRVSKTVAPSGSEGKTTWYVRDAQGNTLATYDKTGNNPIYWREQHLYGSSRLGLWKADLQADVLNTTKWDIVGDKRYELTNHLGNVMAVISDFRTLPDANYKAQLWAANDYYAFGSQMPTRSVNLGDYRYGFNGKENDNEVKGEGNSIDFGDRGYDPRIGRWNKVDSKQEKYPGHSPYHFGYNNPIITIDPDGKENIVVVGNQGHSPNSDFKNGKSKDGYRYGENKRHFLEAGLNEALRLKTDQTDNGEGTTLVIYKGNYSAKELKQYRHKAEKAGITILEVTSAKEITNYVNTQDVKGDNLWDNLFGSDRASDKITDFSYVGHGWTKALYTGYNAIKEGVDYDPLYTNTFKVGAFDLNTDVNLNACASGFDVMDDFVNRLTGGEVTGYKVTMQWGEKGLGSAKPFEKFYYPPGDPRRNSSARPTIPEKDRTRTEQGRRTN